MRGSSMYIWGVGHVGIVVGLAGIGKLTDW